MYRSKRVITYSRNVFIPVTNMCRNSCRYCGFKRDPDDPGAYLMNPAQVEEVLHRGVSSGCTEALFTFGERPEQVAGYEGRLKSLGYDSTLDYLIDLCRMAIGMGLLPHSNPGVLTFKELERLKNFNASMGLMLETTSVLDAHRDSPGKDPAVRIRTIEDAGRLKIPFTTGLLVGIGENRYDRIESLKTIALLHRKYGHIQEVIIQNFSPKANTSMAGHRGPSIEDMIWTVEQAREILPPEVAVQVPPNLISPAVLIEHGASDLGGISRVTIDHINPEHEWPALEKLRKDIGPNNTLRERLPIYPRYVVNNWFSEEIRPLIGLLAGTDGYRKRY